MFLSIIISLLALIFPPGVLLRENCTLSEVRCGSPVRQPFGFRIVGGHVASIGALPWIVTVVGNNKALCGGAIINKFVVISAAHCFHGHPEVHTWQVVVGNHHLAKHDFGEKTIEVKKIIMHERFDDAQAIYDVALLILSEDIEYSETIRPICLPTKSQTVRIGQNCVIAGWGETQGTGDREILNLLTVPILSDSTCAQEDWYGEEFFPNITLCAGFEKGEKDSCQGDSGSPLSCKRNRWWVITGISSWGHGCARSKLPGIYTNVHYFLDWIEHIFQEEGIEQKCYH